MKPDSLPTDTPSGIMKGTMEEHQTRAKSQILIVIIIVLVVLVFTDLNHRMADARQLERDFEVLQTEVALLERQNTELEAQVTALASDALVRDWAHSEARMVLPGEQLVVPLPDSVPSPTTDPAVSPEQDIPSAWDVWRALLFGK